MELYDYGYDPLPPCPSEPHPKPDVRCPNPKCRSTDVSFSDQRAAAVGHATPPGTPAWRWTCKTCGRTGEGLHP
jgi:hypothetical protein